MAFAAYEVDDDDLALDAEPRVKTELTPVLFFPVGEALHMALICFDFEVAIFTAGLPSLATGFELPLVILGEGTRSFVAAAYGRRLAID